jgi:hypothetical protein
MKAITGYKQKDFVEVALLFEADGLGVHRSIIGKTVTEFDVFTISHVQSGNAIVIAIDGLEAAKKCLKWIAAQAKEAGYPMAEIKGNIREERGDRRNKLIDIVKQARELFIKEEPEW